MERKVGKCHPRYIAVSSGILEFQIYGLQFSEIFIGNLFNDQRAGCSLEGSLHNANLFSVFKGEVVHNNTAVRVDGYQPDAFQSPKHLAKRRFTDSQFLAELCLDQSFPGFEDSQQNIGLQTSINFLA